MKQELIIQQWPETNLSLRLCNFQQICLCLCLVKYTSKVVVNRAGTQYFWYQPKRVYSTKFQKLKTFQSVETGIERLVKFRIF